MFCVDAGVYEGRLHSGALTGHSDPNRLRQVPPLIGAEVLNRLAEYREGGGLYEQGIGDLSHSA